jgi:hypothetical protein
MMRKVLLLATVAGVLTGAIVGCSALRVEPAPPESPDQVRFDRHISPLLTTYCVSCQSGLDAPAGIALNFTDEEAARHVATTEDDFWSRVATNVAMGQMPPAYAPRKPTDAERALLLDWINNNVLTANGMPDPGPFIVRRLNNREFANTVRDLLYLPPDYDVASDFPADERGDGFDNNAATLTISPLLIENYLAAAERATEAALALSEPDLEIVGDPNAVIGQPTRRAEGQPLSVRDTLTSRLMLNAPSEGVLSDYANRLEVVRVNMETFAPRAFRRPVTSEEIDGLMEFAALEFAHSGFQRSKDPGLALAIRGTLLSPEFLFRLERDPDPDGTGKVFELTEYQLASRLSYFLWSTMPDDELFIAAREGTLRANLDVHVRRMLQDPKAIALTTDFLGQWLEIRGLEEVPNVPAPLLAAMKGETEHFFDYLVRQDRSIMEFLDADFTFVNESLARLYGIPGVTGDEFRRVEVDRSRRGGIFTQASFLTLTSKPLGESLRTSPVVRGKWILENIFNQTIPPPPPNVPELEIDQNRELKGTVRQIFEQHREDPTCAGCHARMDPYGFALENYDGLGAWREQDNGVDVDASGEINGRTFTTPLEFRAILAERQDDFRIALVRKMLSYVLGRGVQGSDRGTVAEIAAAVQADRDRFSSLILHIAQSYPFQHSRGTVSRMPQAAPTGALSGGLYHPVREEPEVVPASNEEVQ